MSSTHGDPTKRRGLAVALLLGLLVMFAPAEVAQASWNGPDPLSTPSGGGAIATEDQTGIIDNSLPDPGEDVVSGGGGSPCAGLHAGHIVKDYVPASNYAGSVVLRCGRWHSGTQKG